MRNEWPEYDAGGMPDLAKTLQKWWRNQDRVVPFPVINRGSWVRLVDLEFSYSRMGSYGLRNDSRRKR